MWGEEGEGDSREIAGDSRESHGRAMGEPKRHQPSSVARRSPSVANACMHQPPPCIRRAHACAFVPPLSRGSTGRIRTRPPMYCLVVSPHSAVQRHWDAMINVLAIPLMIPMQIAFDKWFDGTGWLVFQAGPMQHTANYTRLCASPLHTLSLRLPAVS